MTQDDLALRIAGLRPGETPFFQPLGTDPEPGSVPDKDLQPIALGVAEQKQVRVTSLSAIISMLPAGPTAPPNFSGQEDGGQTWALIDLSDRVGMIFDVKFFDLNVGFVFAGTSGDLSQSNALILKTTDGGRTWRQVYRSTRLNEII